MKDFRNKREPRIEYEEDVEYKVPMFEDILKEKINKLLVENDVDSIVYFVNAISSEIEPLYDIVENNKTTKANPDNIIIQDISDEEKDTINDYSNNDTKINKKMYFAIPAVAWLSIWLWFAATTINF